MSWRRLFTVLIKEFQELFRDRKILAIIFVAPVAQLIIFGYAATYDVKDIPIAILDHDHSSLSRRLVRMVEASGYFEVTRYLDNESEIDGLMQSGEVWCVLAIPTGLGEQIAAGRGMSLGAAFDASNSNSAAITANYLAGTVMRLNDELQNEQLAALPAGTTRSVGTVSNEVRIWYNPDLESRNFNVPAMVVQILVVITLMLTSMAIVREKEFGTMEQLIVTPIKSSELIVGKALPYAFIGMVDIAIVCTVAVYYFNVPLRGSITLLFVTSLLFMLSTLAIGLLISTISITQQQAMMSAFFVMMPAILLSGFAFPIENMPQSIQYLTYLNPLRYFVVIIRSLFLKGVSFRLLLDQIIPLAALGIGVLAIAVLRFRKRSA